MNPADKMRVSASLWSAPAASIEQEAMRLAAAGLRSWHWDRSDGSMAAAGGFVPDQARRITRMTGLAAEAHLMMEQPLPELDQWIEFCDLIAVHAESPEWRAAVARIQEHGLVAAVAISPGSNLTALDIPVGAFVLVMSITPGNAGEQFRSGTAEKVGRFASRTAVGVDGGLTMRRALECREAGATWLVSGTSLLGAADPEAWLSSVRGSVPHSP